MIRKIGKQMVDLRKCPHIMATMTKSRRALHCSHDANNAFKPLWYIGTKKVPLTPGFFTLKNLERHCKRRGYEYGVTAKHVAKAMGMADA